MMGLYRPQRREARLARRPMCPLPVFWVYNKVGDSGDVAIQKQGISIADIHEPVFAISLSSLSYTMNSSPHRNQISLVGRHREVCRFVSLGLHRIATVRQHIVSSRATKDIRRRRIDFQRLLGNRGDI